MRTDLPARSIIRWLPEYAVGVEEIDHEHRGLFSMAEKLHAAMQGCHGKEVLAGLLGELVDYTCYHFSHEEKLMDRIQYPHYLDHCRQHEELRSRVQSMREQAVTGEASMTVDVMHFLLEWLKCHTTTSDRRIGTYMRTCGLIG